MLKQESNSASTERYWTLALMLVPWIASSMLIAVASSQFVTRLSRTTETS